MILKYFVLFAICSFPFVTAIETRDEDCLIELNCPACVTKGCMWIHADGFNYCSELNLLTLLRNTTRTEKGCLKLRESERIRSVSLVKDSAEEEGKEYREMDDTNQAIKEWFLQFPSNATEAVAQIEADALSFINSTMSKFCKQGESFGETLSTLFCSAKDHLETITEENSWFKPLNHLPEVKDTICNFLLTRDELCQKWYRQNRM